MGGEQEHTEPDHGEPEPGEPHPARNDQSRALHPSNGQPTPEQFRRCDRHWFDPALAGCDDCGRAMCPDCVIAVDGVTTLCDACSILRSSTRSGSRTLESRRDQGRRARRTPTDD